MFFCDFHCAIIKQKYTLHKNLHLSAFLLKVEMMLFDWSEATITIQFAIITDISSDMKLIGYK